MDKHPMPDDLKDMAPPDAEWHQMFTDLHFEMSRRFRELMEHPSYSGSEDLGDWVDTITTLLSFAPHTDPYFHQQTRLKNGLDF